MRPETERLVRESWARFEPVAEQSAAFFPLFPALVYVLGWAIGSNLAAGVLISLAAAAVGGFLGSFVSLRVASKRADQ